MHFVTLVTMELFSNTFHYFHHPLTRIIQFCHPRYVERRLVVVLLITVALHLPAAYRCRLLRNVAYVDPALEVLKDDFVH